MTSFYRCLLYFTFIFIAWAIYRLYGQFPEIADELIAKPILWLFPLYFLLPYTGIVLFHKTHLRKFLYSIGVAIVIGILMSIVRIFSTTGGTAFPREIVAVTTDKFIYALIISFITAIVEEMVFRGYILQTFFLKIKNEWIANCLTAILFVLMHLPLLLFVLHYDLVGSMYYCLVISIVSIVSGILFFRYRSIFPSIIFHAVWNIFSTLLP